LVCDHAIEPTTSAISVWTSFVGPVTNAHKMDLTQQNLAWEVGKMVTELEDEQEVKVFSFS